jgi:hypothetical protein
MNSPTNASRGSVFLSEQEHREFALAGCSFADWKSGAHADRQRTLDAEREARSKEAAALEPYVSGKPPKAADSLLGKRGATRNETKWIV